MVFQFSPYAIPMFLAAAVTGLLALYALCRRQQTEALIFGLLMVAQTWSQFLYALNVSGANLETSYLANRLKYLGGLAVPPLWFVLALQYTHRGAFLTRRNLLLIFVPAMVMFPIVMTDPLTEWWWIGVKMGEFNGYPALFSEGTSAIYKINLVILYLYILAGVWLYIRFYLRTERIYRFQVLLMILAGILPVAANVITQGIRDIFPWGLESFFFTLSGLLVAVAIFRYRFLDIMPVARRAIVEQVPDGVIVADAHGRVIDANPAALAILRADGPITGRPLDESTHIPNLKQSLALIARSDEDSAERHDVSLDTDDGERVLSLTTTPLHRGDTPIGHIILLRDITERMTTQRTLEVLYHQAELERAKLELTISTATDAIALLNTEGKVLASNPPAQSILRARDSREFPPGLQEFLQQAKDADRISKTEIEVGEQSLHVTAAPVIGIGLVLTMHDVTHFRELARMKDDFVATVSHDLRTPLTAILGNIEIAQEETMPREERRDALKRAEKMVYRMAALISDLLDLAKLETGIPLHVAEVEMDQLVREATEDLAEIAAAKGLSIQYDLSRPLPMKVDRRLITQVWRNLVDNAIKYTEEGTIVVRVKAEESQAQMVGQVIDTGIGISPVDLPYVFDKFFRADHPKMLDIGGTGLGLALAKSIVEKHDGQIWVESEPSLGSTFTFTLPC
jgi:PAS domain S-box-containing protein